MSGRLSQDTKPALGRISSPKPMVTPVNFGLPTTPPKSNTAVTTPMVNKGNSFLALFRGVKEGAKIAKEFVASNRGYTDEQLNPPTKQKLPSGRVIQNKYLPNPKAPTNPIRGAARSVEEFGSMAAGFVGEQLNKVPGYTEAAQKITNTKTGGALADVGSKISAFSEGPHGAARNEQDARDMRLGDALLNMPTGGTLKVGREAITLIAKSKDASEIAGILKKEVPNLTDRGAEVLGHVLVRVTDEGKVETVLNRVDFAVNRPKETVPEQQSLPKGRVAPETAPQPSGTRPTEIQQALPSPTAETPSYPIKPVIPTAAVGEGSGAHHIDVEALKNFDFSNDHELTETKRAVETYNSYISQGVTKNDAITKIEGSYGVKFSENVKDILSSQQSSPRLKPTVISDTPAQIKKPLKPETVPEHNTFDKAFQMTVEQKHQKTAAAVERITKQLDEAKALKPEVDKIPRIYSKQTPAQRDLKRKYDALTDKRFPEFLNFWNAPSIQNPKISRVAALKYPSESAKTAYRAQYVKEVKKLISTGHDVPQEIINQYPEFKKAVDARARYDKGHATSFANKSIAVDETTKATYGFKVKRQDGKPITPEQIKEITQASDDLSKAVGPFKDIVEKLDLTVAHTSGKFPFLRGDAGGLHIRGEHTISIGVGDIKAFAHEMMHVFDNASGTMASPITKHFSRGGEYDAKLISEARNHMNGSSMAIDRQMKAKPNMTPEEKKQAQLMKARLSGYYRTDLEIFARLGEQLTAEKVGKSAAADTPEFYQTALGYWDKETFDRLRPMIEAEINKKMALAREKLGIKAEPVKLTPYDTPSIIEARQKALSLPETAGIDTPERIQMRKDIVDEVFGAGATTKGKRIDVVTGMPASGKSSTIAEPLKEKHGAILADSDILKEKLPEFNGGLGASVVHQESSVMNRELLNKAFADGSNIVYPTVGENADRLKRLVDMAKGHGYEVHLHHVEVDPHVATKRVIQRFKETGRFVDPHYVLNKVGLRPTEVHGILKGYEGITTHAHYSNDVPRGQAPRLVESNGHHDSKGTHGSPTGISGSFPEHIRTGGDNSQGINTRKGNVKLEKMAANATNFNEFLSRTGVTKEALDSTVMAKGYKSAESYYEAKKTPEQPYSLSEDESLALVAEEHHGSELALHRSSIDDERVSSNLRSVFADLKGVEIQDLNLRFTEEDLNQAEQNYEFLADTLLDDPARALVKYISKSTGKLPEVTGNPTIKSLRDGKTTVKNSEYGQHGDQIIQEVFGYERQMTTKEAQVKLDEYLKRKKDTEAILTKVKEIKHNIRISKQAETFVGAAKKKLALELSRNLSGLKAIIDAAERGGFRKGLSAGSKKYEDMVARLRARRVQINSLQHRYNLTDPQMKKILQKDYVDKNGKKRTMHADPRFMEAEEYKTYMEGVEKRAEYEHARNEEMILIDAIVSEGDLKKTENLQRAMELPPVKDMSLTELQQFSDELAKTQAGDTFLGPRMIQTALNTDLGAIKTIEEGRNAIAKQTKMPVDLVEGSKMDRWLRDSTLVGKDPLHKLIITEWAAREADMLTRKAQLREHLSKLANASRKARRVADVKLRKEGKLRQTLADRLFARVAPQDKHIITYLEADPVGLNILEAQMTPEEVAFGQYLRGFYQKYHQMVSEDAANRWTLRGVKYSRFKDMYFPHMTRKFFERMRDDGFMRALHVLWDRNVESTRIDFNAFGDRGEVLGYEKWFKNNMKREGAKTFSQNAVAVSMSYFHAFERKLLLDAMIPKGKLLEFLIGKRFQTPKSIGNPDGAEQVHSVLTNSLNEWFNNKKGQKVHLLYDQGDRAEAFVDAASMFVSMLDLGGNIITQGVSAIGGEQATFRGVGFKGWALGHKRSITAQGRKIAAENPGIIGEHPWNDIANAANDLGDTLRSSMFYLFGDLSFRARRQMLLAKLTPEEFASGIISSTRKGEIKLDIGKWHTMPEFRSVIGSTSLMRAASKYTEWATPQFQTAWQDLGKLIKETQNAAKGKKLDAFMKSPHFKQTLTTILVAIGSYALGQIIFQPDKNDKSFIGQARYKAARESSSLLQAVSGQVYTNVRMQGFLKDIFAAASTMAHLDRYATDGPGHRAGDLKGPAAIEKALIPTAIKQFIPQKTTPVRTKKDIAQEILSDIQSGKLTPAAAKLKLKAELASLAEKERNTRFEATPKVYATGLRDRLQSKEITPADAAKELKQYQTFKKEHAPEQFESDSDSSFIDKVKVYAQAVGTDPVTAFNRIFSGQVIRRTDNGAIIVRRMDYTASQQVKKDRGATKGLKLDHTLPLELGGSNAEDNLKLVPESDWKNYSPIENYLGKKLRDGTLSKKDAQKAIIDFKEGRLTADQVKSTY